MRPLETAMDVLCLYTPSFAAKIVSQSKRGLYQLAVEPYTT